MSVKIRPVGEKILLMFPSVLEENVGGVIIKNPGRRDGVRDAVVKALPSCYRGDLSVGDHVFVKPWCGTELVLNGERIAFVKEAEILAGMEV